MLQNNASVRAVHRESGFDFGEFRTREGGAKEGENTLVRHGGMSAPVAYAGTWAYGEMTAARVVRFQSDSGLIQQANDMFGERLDFTHQPTDAKGRPGFHRPVVYSGLVNGVTAPEYDADSNDPQLLTFTITVDSVV